MLAKPFQPECHTNINRMNNEYKEYCNKIIQKFVPRKTANRQSGSVWYKPSTSKLFKPLKTQRMLYSTNSTSYRKQKILEQEKIFFDKADRDKTDYQNILLSNWNTKILLQNFKSMYKTASNPDEIPLGEKNSKQFSRQNRAL